MKITILGAGNMGCANAADLTLKGHEVTLVKTSHSMHNETFDYVCAHNNEITLWQEGEEQTARIHAVTTDLSSVATADLVYITTQTNVHEQLIQRIAPLLRKGQVVLISPGYFSTAYFLKHCPDKDLTIIEDHRELIEAIAARDKKRAAEAMDRHLSRWRPNEERFRKEYPPYFKPLPPA